MTLSYLRPDLFRYASRRSDVHARNMVCTSQPLAVQAGLDAMRNGGNAVDAALTAAICLTVVEPTGNGIGSDAFAMVYHDGQLSGFNGSGRSPAAWDAERFKGLSEMPQTGWESVTVPGAVNTWVELSRRFGKLPFAELFPAAIHYARSGFAVTPVIQRLWAHSIQRCGEFAAYRDTYMPGGRAPEVGESFRSPGQAATLEEIARTGGESFYRGDLATSIEEDALRHGAAMTRSDLAGHAGFWVEPLRQDYGSVTVHEIPPNGQGLAALIALGILRHLDIGRYAVDSPDALHLQIEAMKQALRDMADHVGDPDGMQIRPDSLLDDGRLADIAGQLDLNHASAAETLVRTDHGTVYLCTGDQDGTMVSMIQSNYEGFGSGIVIPGTGISMQNRGAGFNLDPDHPNGVAGGKRPFHTIIPGFMSRHGQAVAAFGVMGGHMQPQGHLQLVCRLEVWRQSLQEAIDAPRWFISEDGVIHLEPGTHPDTIADLAGRGHRIDPDCPFSVFGGAQALLKTSCGYQGASDPRKDGCAAGY
jgi:gamma-glutamyltranspeptidase / glutathione hydrolase